MFILATHQLNVYQMTYILMSSYVLVFVDYMVIGSKWKKHDENYIVQTPPRWPQHNLCLMPMLMKGEI